MHWSENVDEDDTKKKSFMIEEVKERMLIPTHNRRRSSQKLRWLMRGESIQMPHEADEKGKVLVDII